MGLFDPPHFGIRKRIPSGAIPEFDELAALTKDAVPSHLSSTKTGLVVGFVVSAWALSQHRRAAIDLNEKDGTYISNMGMNCARMLGADQEVAFGMVRYLTSKGVISDPD